MDRNKQDIRYEELYNRLLERGIALHEINKKRIRAGLIFLGVFTVLMILIRIEPLEHGAQFIRFHFPIMARYRQDLMARVFDRAGLMAENVSGVGGNDALIVFQQGRDHKLFGFGMHFANISFTFFAK
jgi:hypothetical protein